MAGLTPFPGAWRRQRPWAGTAAVALALLLLAWPAPARAGWFVRDNQTAYQLTREGHDRQALTYWDGSAEGLYGRGTALLHLGRMHEAEQAFRQSLAVAPHKTGFADDLRMPEARRPGFLASLWYNLGNALYAQGKLAEARQAWLKTLHFKPGHTHARHNLAIVDRVLGERERRDRQPLAGLTGARRKQSGKNQTPASAGSTQQQQRSMRHGLLPLHRSGGSDEAGPSGASSKPKGAGQAGAAAAGARERTGHAVAHGQGHHQSRSAAAGAPASGKGDGGARASRTGGKGMSAEQASKELGMVNEGVSVFLRHRLGQKSSQAASAGAGDKPW